MSMCCRSAELERRRRDCAADADSLVGAVRRVRREQRFWRLGQVDRALSSDDVSQAGGATVEAAVGPRARKIGGHSDDQTSGGDAWSLVYGSAADVVSAAQEAV